VYSFFEIHQMKNSYFGTKITTRRVQLTTYKKTASSLAITSLQVESFDDGIPANCGVVDWMGLVMIE